MDKNSNVKKEINKNNSDVFPLIDKKLEFFKDVIQKTIIHVQKNKILDILGINDVSICIERLGDLSKKLQEICENNNNNAPDVIINNLQLINNELSSLLKNYGTDSLEDLLLICFGNNNKITTNETEYNKLELLKKYFHPTSYKVATKKDDAKKKADDVEEPSCNLNCYDVVQVYKQFHMKVYGIKVFLYSSILKKTLIIFGILDDVIVDFLNNKHIGKINKTIKDKKKKLEEELSKKTKECPPGKVLNLVTGRCNKIKNKTIKIKEIKRKEEKICPPGKELNTKTHRCNKIKTNTIKIKKENK
jgi:hypothetical protein